MTLSWESSLSVKGKTAVVTGSSRGVGRAVAVALARAGAAVAINYVTDENAADEAMAEIKGSGGLCLAVRADVSSEEGAAELVKKAEETLGPVDILVNNAHGNILRVPLHETSWEEHERQIRSVVGGAYMLSRLVAGGMAERGWGRIVNVGNNMVTQPVPGYSAYTTAMAAMLGLTRNMAAELGGHNVTVNMVSPGFVVTGQMPNTTEAVREGIAASTPLGRLAVPDDVAGVVLFFCSEMSRFLTGADISVDGGKVMG